MRARLGLFSAVVIALLWPGAMAAGSNGYGAVHVSVRPAVGSQKAEFFVSSIAQRTGFVPSSLSGYRVVASGRAARGCVSGVAVAVPATWQGERVRVGLRTPSRWCPGTYAGRLELVIRPSCGFRELCPLARQLEPAFIAVLTVGRFGFRVR